MTNGHNFSANPSAQRRRTPELEDARTELIRASHRGGMTLVVGAGISMARGLPSWDALGQDLWREAFGRRRSPWNTASGKKSPREVPQFLPIVFELAHERLGAEAFLQILRQKLYQNARFPFRDPQFPKSPESLAVLARLIVQEFKRGRDRRIDAIVTLNADDLLEQAAFALVGGASFKLGREVVRVVARPTHSPVRGDKFQPIRVYHIHGFLPSNIRTNYGAKEGLCFADAFNHMLVFTDAQYWSTSATALAFANRVMLSVLSESRCVFIGLSMTDINLLRWLALRTLERDRDVNEVKRLGKGAIQAGIIERMFSRHFWIRPKTDDPTGFLSEFLAIRGIHSVEIKSWAGSYFQRLIEMCFAEGTVNQVTNKDTGQR